MRNGLRAQVLRLRLLRCDLVRTKKKLLCIINIVNGSSREVPGKSIITNNITNIMNIIINIIISIVIGSSREVPGNTLITNTITNIMHIIINIITNIVSGSSREVPGNAIITNNITNIITISQPASTRAPTSQPVSQHARANEPASPSCLPVSDLDRPWKGRRGISVCPPS